MSADPPASLSPPANVSLVNARERLPALDAMRLVAAIGILWIHTVESDTFTRTVELGRFAVPFFTIASLWLLGQSLRRRSDLSWARYARSRTILLYGTFFLWNAIYAAARLTKHRLLHTGMPLELTASGVMMGFSEQLWFLPALLVASIAAFPVIRLAIGLPEEKRLVVMLVTIVLAAGVGQLPAPHNAADLAWNNAVQAGYFMLPSVFAGIAAAVIFPSSGESAFRAAIVVSPVLVISVAHVLFIGRSPTYEMLAGLCVFVISITLSNGPIIRLLAAGGRYAMGIYLAHVLFVEAIQAFAHRAGFGASAALDAIVAASALAFSLAASIVLRRTPLVPR